MNELLRTETKTREAQKNLVKKIIKSCNKFRSTYASFLMALYFIIFESMYHYF